MEIYRIHLITQSRTHAEIYQQKGRSLIGQSFIILINFSLAALRVAAGVAGGATLGKLQGSAAIRTKFPKGCHGVVRARTFPGPCRELDNFYRLITSIALDIHILSHSLGDGIRTGEDHLTVLPQR